MVDEEARKKVKDVETDVQQQGEEEEANLLRSQTPQAAGHLCLTLALIITVVWGCCAPLSKLTITQTLTLTLTLTLALTLIQTLTLTLTITLALTLTLALA